MPKEPCGGDVCISPNDLKMMGERIDQAERERNSLRAQLAEREAECATMREALQKIYNRLPTTCWDCEVNTDECYHMAESCAMRELKEVATNPLSSSAGKDLLERMRRAEELLREVHASGVSFEDDRVRYVEVQLSKNTLTAIDAFLKGGGEDA